MRLKKGTRATRKSGSSGGPARNLGTSWRRDRGLSHARRRVSSLALFTAPATTCSSQTSTPADTSVNQIAQSTIDSTAISGHDRHSIRPRQRLAQRSSLISVSFAPQVTTRSRRRLRSLPNTSPTPGAVHLYQIPASRHHQHQLSPSSYPLPTAVLPDKADAPQNLGSCCFCLFSPRRTTKLTKQRGTQSWLLRKSQPDRLVSSFLLPLRHAFLGSSHD